MKIAIVGSRNYPDLDKVGSTSRTCQKALSQFRGADGVDETAEDEARKLGLEVISISPEWNKYGKTAGLIRNDLIVLTADCVVAFWDGVSRGTKYTIDKAREKNVITQIFNIVN